jgi:hypothetical protein
MAPSSKKSLTYLIYSIGTNSNVHVWVFQKIIQVNGEKQDTDIMNLFCFTLRDAISEWGEDFMQSHPSYIFLELEATFCKQYHTI